MLVAASLHPACCCTSTASAPSSGTRTRTRAVSCWSCTRSVASRIHRGHGHSSQSGSCRVDRRLRANLRGGRTTSRAHHRAGPVLGFSDPNSALEAGRSRTLPPLPGQPPGHRAPARHEVGAAVRLARAERSLVDSRLRPTVGSPAARTSRRRSAGSWPRRSSRARAAPRQEWPRRRGRHGPRLGDRRHGHADLLAGPAPAHLCAGGRLHVAPPRRSSARRRRILHAGPDAPLGEHALALGPWQTASSTRRSGTPPAGCRGRHPVRRVRRPPQPYDPGSAVDPRILEACVVASGV